MMKKTLLMGTLPEVRPILARIFSEHYDLVFCYEMREAVAALEGGRIDAVGCSIYFDGGKTFELLRLMKGNPATRHIPFFTASAAGAEMLPGVEQGIDIATRALGGNGVIPFARWRREDGDAKAFRRLLDLFARTIRESEARTG